MKAGGRTHDRWGESRYLISLSEAEKRDKPTFRSGSDSAREYYGPGRASHPAAWRQALADLERAGADISWRPGQLGYSPGDGRPGRVILDPDASYSALRHEARHFWDDRSRGWPGLVYYLYRQPDEFWQLEYNGYLEEIKLARAAKNFDLGWKIVQDMRARRREILGR